MLLKFIPGLFGRGPLFPTKTDVSTVPSTAIISVKISSCTNAVSYTHLDVYKRQVVQLEIFTLMMAVDGTFETSVLVRNNGPRPNIRGMNFNNKFFIVLSNCALM